MGARIYWGKIIILWGDFELGARLLTFGGILLTFGGVIINYIKVVPPLFTFKDLLNGNCDGYLGLLWNLVKLPVDDHPKHEHEESSPAATLSWS